MALLTILPLLRRYTYEFFLCSHLVLAIVLAITLWEHLRLKKHLSRLLIIVASGLFLFTSLYQYAFQLHRNIKKTNTRKTNFGFQLVKVTRVKQHGESLIVELKLARPWTIQPGQHVFLTLLNITSTSFFQRHPFAITWWNGVEGETEATVIYVMIDPQRGWTGKVMLRPKVLTNSIAWLDGPFGKSYDLQEYGTVLLFASGTGIFAQLPLVKGLTERAKYSAIKTRRIKLVWQTEEYHDQLQEWMQSILDDTELDHSVCGMNLLTYED